MNTIIEVRGGCVVAVYSKHPERFAFCEVTIVDWDAAEGSEDGKPSVFSEQVRNTSQLPPETMAAIGLETVP